MTNHVGQQLGNYRLLQLLGRGHWASVYLGEHRHLHTQAAIKVLHDPLGAGEVEDFLTEARTLARLRHPQIVRILDFGLQEDTPFLVMDYAPGGTLRTFHPHGTRLPLETVIPYVKQVAEALQYAHEQRLIHRDLKPENLLLGPEQQIWLADFGLAVLVHGARSQSFQQIAGTLAYMAPEQLKNQPTPASDQYALGIMVYEWLCGERPFAGSFPELAVQHTRVPPPSLLKKAPTLPVMVEHVVLKALAKDPKFRFVSAQAFALALEEASRAETSSRQTRLMPSSHYFAVSRQAARCNLPAQLTPLIGREQEVTAICPLLRRHEVRLITLTGTGGVGKTRLALQVLTEVLADFPDGVSFVSLAPISDPALIMPTIAQVLDVKESGARPLPDLLTAFLRDKHLLLCLDNFEHLLPAAPQLTDLLTTCSHLTMLVTSRAALHVQGEHLFPVPPLVVPDLTQRPPTAETLPRYAAVALFLQRAQAIQPTFQITSTNARPLAEVCIRLEGLPLAIELAAARITLFPPQALLARLTQRLQLLTSGTRNVPARQQTLRNTIEWSYQLLDAQEQRLFRRLSAFVGGCTLEAIEAVCVALEKSHGVGHVLDGVASLLDKSLLQRTERDGEEPRFAMLETLREYGLEALASGREAQATHAAHAAYYLALAEQAEPELSDPQQLIWFERLEREHDNLRAALSWFLEHSSDGQSRELALRLSGALVWFWCIRGYVSEGRHWLEQALDTSEKVRSAMRAKALMAAGELATEQDDYGQAEALCREGLALYRELGDRWGCATALSIWGYAAMMRSNYTEARALLEEALVLFREVGDTWGSVRALNTLASVLFYQGEYARAQILLEESLVLSKEGEVWWGHAISLTTLGLVLLSQGHLAQARARLEESLAVSREVGYKRYIGMSSHLLGLVAFLQGDVARARSLEEEALVLFKEVGERIRIAEVFASQGLISFKQGDYTAAHARLQESLKIALELDYKWDTALCLEELAAVVAAQGEPVRAVWCMSAAQALRQAIGTPLPSLSQAMHEFTIASVRTHLGEQAFDAAWAQGRAMTPEQTLAAQGAVTIPTPVPLEQPSTRPAKPSPAYPDGLTAREVEVLRLLARGLTNAQIAEGLVVSLLTVKAHLRSIYSKLGVTSRSAATRYALEHDLS